jgi:hypothetical protein
LGNANIPASGNCTITVGLQSASAGQYSISIAAKDLVTAPAGANTAGSTATLTVTAPSSGGGGAIDWIDVMGVVALVLVLRRPSARMRR